MRVCVCVREKKSCFQCVMNARFMPFGTRGRTGRGHSHTVVGCIVIPSFLGAILQHLQHGGRASAGVGYTGERVNKASIFVASPTSLCRDCRYFHREKGIKPCLRITPRATLVHCKIGIVLAIAVC